MLFEEKKPEDRMPDKMKNSPGNETNQPTDSGYWQAFEELYQDQDFLRANENEFNEEALNTTGLSALSRRKFLALLGASAAFAGAGCSDYRDKGEIIPYNIKPEEITPGKPNYYASTCTSCPNACGILIKTREGRPIKIDGNPDHPVSRGKICAQGQASIMNLYDPDRLKNPKKKSGNVFVDYNWKDAEDEILLDLMSAGEDEIAIVSHKIISPTTKKVLDEFTSKYPSTKIYTYEQFDNRLRKSAWKKCYGSDEFPALKWNEADVILSLDGDFLGGSDNKIENTRLFSEGRDVIGKKFNRLYVVEGNLSITGMNADYRLRLRSDLQINLLLALIEDLNAKGVINLPISSGYSLNKISNEYDLELKVLEGMAEDLAKNKGKSIIYAGSHLPENVHILVNAVNSALGNEKIYDFENSIHSVIPLSGYADLKSLSDKMNNNEVAMVIHLNSNPVYHLPSDLGYIEGLENVSTIVSLVELENESSQFSHYVLPVNNQLESWGDAKTRKGFYSLQQPVIAPLYDTRQAESVLLTWTEGFSEAYEEAIYHKFLMRNWEENVYPKLNNLLNFNRFWYTALHDGVFLTKEEPVSLSSFNRASLSALDYKTNHNSYSLRLKESYTLKDGRFANNGWLQELPHPVSKVTWDNYAALSPKSAKNLGLKNNDIAEIKSGNRSLKIPVFIQPGASDNSITIELGYGRTKGGTVGTNVGFNAGSLMSFNNGISPWLFTKVEINKTGETYKLVTAQTVYAFDSGTKKNLPEKRGIIREGTVEEYMKNPEFLHEGKSHKDISVNPPVEYSGLKWGMSIDMNKCLGCSECVVACNVENNIPVVGKDQVAVGREMQWLRVDRYYSGTPEDPSISNQVMLCQHCDQAPCENVCPVVATTHSPDGLNQMIYNRCVGTRYCSNNCPYKVRRFNYFDYRDYFREGYQGAPVFALLQNPEVTVRSRGVMEKCTFCIQRIADARSDAISENKELKGSDVTTACQEACGTNAIKFGDLNDEESEVYKLRNHELGYHVLDELNIKPNVTYIAKLRNTKPGDV